MRSISWADSRSMSSCEHTIEMVKTKFGAVREFAHGSHRFRDSLRADSLLTAQNRQARGCFAPWASADQTKQLWISMSRVD